MACGVVLSLTGSGWNLAVFKLEGPCLSCDVGYLEITGRQPDQVTSWHDFFMNTAKVAAQRSKDPVCPVGACIASKDNVVVGVGHNCMPRGKDDLFDYWTEITDKGDQRKHKFVCHAELNAIVNAQRTDLTDCTMYVTRIPCADCAKLIVQSNIKRVFYIMDKYGEVAKEIFDILRQEGFELIEYKPTNPDHVFKTPHITGTFRLE